jgi:hypothetical protein
MQDFGQNMPREREVMIYQRHCEERSDAAIHSSLLPRDGLLRWRSQ